MIKLVLSDMDETLKRANEPLVPKRTLKAITALKEAGIDFGPATGRSAYDALPFYGFDARYLQTAICGSGKVVYGKGALVAKRVLSAKTLERILQVIARYKDTYLAYFDEGPAEPPLDVSIRPAWMIFGVTQAQVDYINAHYDSFTAAQGPNTVPHDKDFISVGILAPQDQLAREAMFDDVLTQIPEIDLVSPYTGWYDVNPKGFSKADGFKILLEYLNLAPNEVVFCGDSGNDLTLLELSPHSFCVSNGSDEAKALATYTLNGTVDEEIVARLMEALVADGGDISGPHVQALIER